MNITLHTVNAFIDGEQGGNPAGVVLDADSLSQQQKQQLAQQVGLSETAFVSSSSVATRKLEFFTPTRQIPHCGHATVAAFSLLRQLGQIEEGTHSKETVDGNRQIVIEADMAYMEQSAPRYERLEESNLLHSKSLNALGLSAQQLLPNVPLTVVNTGNAFLMVGLAEEHDLRSLQVNQALVQEVSEVLDLIGFYAFSLHTQRPGRAAGARMFAPRYGIPEESGTGMAAGPLACLLHAHGLVSDTALAIEQGWLMNPASPSVISVKLDIHHGKIRNLLAGGTARIARTLQLDL